MTLKVGYISGSSKHRHKVHVLVEFGPQCAPPDEHAGGEYEVHWAVTACGIDTRTKSGRKWTALVLGPSDRPLDEPYMCRQCRKKIGR